MRKVETAIRPRRQPTKVSSRRGIWNPNDTDLVRWWGVWFGAPFPPSRRPWSLFSSLLGCSYPRRALLAAREARKGQGSKESGRNPIAETPNVIGIRVLETPLNDLSVAEEPLSSRHEASLHPLETYLSDRRHGHPLGSGQESRTQHHR